MLRLTFTSAKQVNYDQNGMSMIYFYKVSGSEEEHSFHVVGVTNCSYMTPQEKYIYAQYLFTGAIAYIKQYWNKHKQLPEADEEIRENSNFGTKTNKRIAWNRYHLNLF
jgi:hypothetical protein